MNKFFICFFSICLTLTAFGQNNVGIGTPTPDQSAILDLSSQTKGFLVPRTKVGLISAPYARGLVIFDTDTGCYVMYNGTAWQNLCSPNLPPQSPGFNDNIYYNTNGTITIVDSNGNHILTTPQAAWLTTGNIGTTAGTNFLGTTDPQDVVVKSNNKEVLRATQSLAVGINTPVPDVNAVLQIQSPAGTNKGVLFPAMTSAQRDAIAGPTVGLTIYDTDLNVHQFWNGTCWVNMGQTVCSFTYAVSQSHNTDCLFKSNFNSVSDTITVSLISGTPSPVILSAAGVPAGVLVNFSNNYLTPTQTSVMTLTALPSAPNGTYTITILAASGSTIQTLIYTLTVYDFAVTLVPNASTITLAQAQAGGTVAQATLTIGNPSNCNANAGNAQLAATVQNNTNNALTVSFGNPNLPVPGSTTMTVTSNCALPGTYQIYVTSTVGVSISTTIYTLTIDGPTPIHISADAYNVNLFALAGQPTCPVIDTFIVDGGVKVGSNTVNAGISQPSITTGNFTAGSQIVIINNGTIEGRGGDGGDKTGYGTYLGGCSGVGDGHPGGNAINIATNGVNIINHGVIGGGGGGGGAGEDLSITFCTTAIRPGTGGGGGAGYDGGAGGSGSGGSYPTNPGSPGGLVTGGAGGPPQNQGPCTQIFVTFGPYNSGIGGNGGNLGLPGNSGGTANGTIGGAGACGAGNGGAPGCGVKTNSFTYVYSGTAPVGTSPTCP
jgi:hypothetical protein